MGKVDGTSWQQLNGVLTLSDPKGNKPGGDSGGTVEGESVARMTVDLLLTLGIKDMLPGSAVWDQDKHRFTAKTKSGTDLVVETTLESGVPAAAYILTSDGQKYIRLQFKYSPGFYGGQVPIEFTAYWVKPGAMNEQSDDLRIYTIRVKALEISDKHLDAALLKPTHTARSGATLFYSNNVLYETRKNGAVSRVLTTEEYRKELESRKTRDQKE